MKQNVALTRVGRHGRTLPQAALDALKKSDPMKQSIDIEPIGIVWCKFDTPSCTLRFIQANPLVKQTGKKVSKSKVAMYVVASRARNLQGMEIRKITIHCVRCSYEGIIQVMMDREKGIHT